MKYMFRAIAVLALIIFTSPYVMAGVLGVPNTFTNGSTANANDVNANFNAVETEVNDNNSRIILNANDITSNATATGANAGAISSNTATIGANTGAISTNTNAIVDNTTAIGNKLSNSVDPCLNPGESIRQIKPDGTVLCETAPTGANSVGQVELKDGLAGANWARFRGLKVIETTGKTVLASVTIQAPKTGGVFVVSASGQMGFGVGFKLFVDCALALNDSNGGVPSGGTIDWSWRTDKEQTPIVLNRAFSLPATLEPTLITTYMLCKRGFDSTKTDAFDTVDVVRADVTVVFVPVHYNPGNP